MGRRHYQWERFWWPRGGSVSLAIDGYLEDPSLDTGRTWNLDAVKTSEIDPYPCLVLLGEPGIGKSTVLAEYCSQRQELEGRQGVLSVDLGVCQTDLMLHGRVFGSSHFQQWLLKGYRLTLFLDSLDECMLFVSTAARLLLDELRQCPVRRLSIRIACRTALWPASLEEGLRELWGGDSVGVFELAPLRRVDVREAAQVEGLDPDAFLSDVDRSQAVPFAIKPITLRFLLGVYRQNGRLQGSLNDLYLEGCRLLCEEDDPGSKPAAAERLPGEHQVVLAARMAAVMVFGRYRGIWTGTVSSEAPQGFIAVRELSGGVEKIKGQDVGVTDALIRRVLNTGLFNSCGPMQFIWSHQTYLEFLAAYYLVYNDMSLRQMMTLITHPEDPEHKLVPQLYGTTTWLASLNPEVFREVAQVEPEVLFAADISEDHRRALIANFLSRLECEALSDLDFEVRRHYRKLAHPDLHQQLEPLIRDRSKGWVVRRAAIDIAEATAQATLLDALVSIALDITEHNMIRAQAARAVAVMGDSSAKHRLKLVLNELGEDPDDEVRGAVLSALWPGFLDVEELFSVLIEPKKKGFFGAYLGFLIYRLAEGLRAEDTVVALKWAAVQPLKDAISYAQDRLVTRVLIKGCEHMDTPGVQHELAVAVYRRLKADGQLSSGHQSETPEKVLRRQPQLRRRLLGELVRIMPPRDLYLLRSLTERTDLGWILECLVREPDPQTQDSWLRVGSLLFDWGDPKHLSTVLKYRRANRLLARSYPFVKLAMHLYLPWTVRLVRRLGDIRLPKAWVGRRRRKSAFRKKVGALLTECERGRPEAWWHLNLLMVGDPLCEVGTSSELEEDITSLPGWRVLDSRTQERMVRAARRFVMEYPDPVSSRMLCEDTLFRPAAAGYRALLLLQKTDRAGMMTLPEGAWAKWALPILCYPVSSGLAKGSPRTELVRTAYRQAPEELIRALLGLIDKDNLRNRPLFILESVRSCWDSTLQEALEHKLTDPCLKPKSLGSLLTELLANKSDGAREYAVSLVRLPIPPDVRTRAVVAASSLLSYGPAGSWDTIWAAIESDREFGRAVVAHILESSLEDQAAEALSRQGERQLADLYTWLVEEYPYSEDPDLQGFIGTRGRISLWRDSLLHRLKTCGTHRACQELQRISNQFPGLTWLRWTVAEAQSINRSKTWVPIKADNLIRMVKERNAGLVRSGLELLAVLVESLRRLQEELQGDTPMARFLWDRTPESTYRPVDESDLCDYIKKHFDQDIGNRGIVVNREVLIRRGHGGRGERTDIHVTAVVRDPASSELGTVKVIVEVKGCWNPSLLPGMKEQLLGRYMNENDCMHGLYVVGWFSCSRWDDRDPRKARVSKLDCNQLRRQLTDQATTLSDASNVAIEAFLIDVSLR